MNKYSHSTKPTYMKYQNNDTFFSVDDVLMPLVKSLFSINLIIRTFCFLLLILLSNLGFSQISFLNNGQTIVNTNAIFVINGDLVHKNDGIIDNKGDFYIKGDCINNNPSSNIFTAGNNGWVHLDGATQIIGGTMFTHFNNIELTGTGIKQLSNVDTEIEDTLSLNDREFAASNNIVFVTSTGSGVVTRTDGFVSSTNDGGLSRNTLSTNTYFFPVGSSAGTVRFRPVDITPNSVLPNTFKVRMANVDATNEGFDRSLKEVNVSRINSYFYHRINRTNGTSSADISLYYDNAVDGDYDLITNWQSSLQWKNMGIIAAANNYGLVGLTKQTVSDFSSNPFALAESVPNIFVANVFSPNGDGTNDVLHVCGKGISQLQFIIFDRWGEKVFETSDISSGWDGTYNGTPLNVGVFVYFIKGKFKNGDVFDKKGNFTLLR